MNTMRKKWLLPIAVFAIAIASAFASNIENTNDVALVNGFIDSPTPCLISVECSTIPGPVCKSGGKTAYKMNAAGTRCDQPAFHLY
ncbi:DUF6520 family protein [Aequorivita viscosa]|nr:DUF6520 family protein [Aequorivita viscosa]